MLANRIIGAVRLRKSVYAEIEKDRSFTPTAWILVIVVALLNQLGSFASSSDLLGWLIGAIVGTILAIIGFVVGALVINILCWVGDDDMVLQSAGAYAVRNSLELPRMGPRPISHQ